jgi:hypothetical protein
MVVLPIVRKNIFVCVQAEISTSFVIFFYVYISLENASVHLYTSS